jgi:tripartite-type tricarboxylate transporter receptor subunit TctC
VPYKGGTPAVTALVAGQVQMMFSNPVSSKAMVESGKLRALAITSKTRSPLFPDVPTVSEAGVPGYESLSWYGVLAPAGTPQAVIGILNKAINTTLATPDVRRQIESAGGTAQGSTPQAFGAFLAADIARWRKLVARNPALQGK